MTARKDILKLFHRYQGEEAQRAKYQSKIDRLRSPALKEEYGKVAKRYAGKLMNLAEKIEEALRE